MRYGMLAAAAIVFPLLIGVAACGSGRSSGPNYNPPDNNPSSTTDWYNSGHAWVEAWSILDTAVLVGSTPYQYCLSVADGQGMGISSPPVSAWPVPGTPGDIAAWVSGCDTAENAIQSARGGTTDPPGSPSGSSATSSPPAGALSGAPSSASTGQGAADSQVQQQVQSDLSTVLGISFNSDLAALHKDVLAAANGVSTLKADVATGPGASCENTSAVNADAYNLFNSSGNGVEASADSDAITLQQDISTARSDIGALKNDVEGLQSAGSPAPPGTQAAITSAQNAVSQAVAQGNAAIDQENALLNQALQAVNSLITPSDQCADAIQSYQAGQPIARIG